MKRAEVVRRRMHAHLLAGPTPTTAAEVVDHLGCVQAQDLTQSLWALGVRMTRPRRSAIGAEIASGAIVRTWPMRGTLHWVRPHDVRWLLDLMAGRVLTARTTRHRQLGLTPETLARGGEIVAAELAGGPKTRPQLFATLDRAGVATTGQRGIHLVQQLAYDAVLVVGPTVERQPTYRLLVEPQVVKTRDEALHEIATRYVRGHGPVTAHDLAFWTGLTVADSAAALAGIDCARDGPLHHRDADPPQLPRRPTLLAGFDEYVLGYRDRRAVLDDGHLEAVVPGRNGVFRPTVVDRGRVVGTWSSGEPTSARTFEGRPIEVDTRAHDRFRQERTNVGRAVTSGGRTS